MKNETIEKLYKRFILEPWDIKEVNRLKLTVAEFRAVQDNIERIYINGFDYTYSETIANFFKSKGFKIEPYNVINYKITAPATKTA